MENAIQQIEGWFLSKKLFIWIYSICLILIGLVYILIQYIYFSRIKDSLFVGLLFGGSFILLFGIKWIQGYFKENIKTFYDSLDKFKKLGNTHFTSLTKKIFKNPLVIFSGIIYGLLIGYVPFLLNIWDDATALKYLLSVFLFVVNFLTGASLFSLIMVFLFLYNISDYLIIKLYDRNNTASNLITDLSKRASLIASFYIAFSITSIYFSELPFNAYIIGYSIFAGIIILIAYIVPMIPIRNKIQIQKSLLLSEISSLIQKELDKIVVNAKSGNSISIEKYNSLLELKNKIAGIHAIPIGFKAIWNSVYIILITLLPVFIQVILEKVIR